MHDRRLIYFALTIWILLVSSGAVFAESGDIEVTLQNGRLVIRQFDDTTVLSIWRGKTRLLRIASNGEVAYTDSFRRDYLGRLKSAKLQLTELPGAATVEFKFYEDKVKITIDGNEFQLKDQGEKFKIEYNGEELGKIVYYPDNGKTKAKTNDGITVAETSDMGYLSASLGAFLLPDASEELSVLILLMLYANNW